MFLWCFMVKWTCLVYLWLNTFLVFPFLVYSEMKHFPCMMMNWTKVLAFPPYNLWLNKSSIPIQFMTEEMSVFPFMNDNELTSPHKTIISLSQPKPQTAATAWSCCELFSYTSNFLTCNHCHQPHSQTLIIQHPWLKKTTKHQAHYFKLSYIACKQSSQ